MKPGEAESMAAHFQLSRSGFSSRLIDGFDIEGEDELLSKASVEMIH